MASSTVQNMNMKNGNRNGNQTYCDLKYEHYRIHQALKQEQDRKIVQFHKRKDILFQKTDPEKRDGRDEAFVNLIKTHYEYAMEIVTRLLFRAVKTASYKNQFKLHVEPELGLKKEKGVPTFKSMEYGFPKKAKDGDIFYTRSKHQRAGLTMTVSQTVMEALDSFCFLLSDITDPNKSWRTTVFNVTFIPDRFRDDSFTSSFVEQCEKKYATKENKETEEE